MLETAATGKKNKTKNNTKHQQHLSPSTHFAVIHSTCCSVVLRASRSVCGYYIMSGYLWKIHSPPPHRASLRGGQRGDHPVPAGEYEKSLDKFFIIRNINTLVCVLGACVRLDAHPSIMNDIIWVILFSRCRFFFLFFSLHE